MIILQFEAVDMSPTDEELNMLYIHNVGEAIKMQVEHNFNVQARRQSSNPLSECANP